MSTSVKQMNKALYRASFHLLEASKYLSNVEEFREDAFNIFQMSVEMASIIQPEPQKITDETMASVLNEILGIQIEEKK